MTETHHTQTSFPRDMRSASEPNHDPRAVTKANSPQTVSYQTDHLIDSQTAPPPLPKCLLTGFSVGFEVGNCASEHMLEAHLRLGRLLSVYLHTKRFGTWVQRRLNPTGYDSREVRLA
ncbi:hypothetical protein [Microbispora sp. CA-102843]|uniref:hypothetical protein n=1 Tax=Microbispora sp. CA-102843 TaxID=3239952 RepID=UPI003D8E0A34